MNNSVFIKTMKNLRKYKDLKLIKTERKGNYLVSQPNYYSTKFFSENLISIEMKKKQIIMNKPVCLGLLILDLSKTVIYEFWCLKPKHGEKVKLCYMDTYSLQKKETANLVSFTEEILNGKLDFLCSVHCSCKNRYFLQRYWRRCWNKTWHLIYEIDCCLWEKIKTLLG